MLEKDHPVLAYNTTAFSLSSGLADIALLGYSTLDDVWEQDMNDGETKGTHLRLWYGGISLPIFILIS